MNPSSDLVIVGGGPAGMAAAVEAANLGIAPVLIDSCPLPGGQFYRQPPPAFDLPPKRGAAAWLERLDRPEIHTLTDTTVWGLFPEESGHLLCLYGPAGTPRRLRAKTVILAPGAYERLFPFPGWTLPGVMTVGAALILVRQQRILPGQRVLISGTGPLPWVLAHELIAAGAEVAALLEANPFPWKGWRYAPGLWGQGERLKEGWQALLALWRTGQSIHWGHTVLAAQGENRVAQAAVGRPDGSERRMLRVDTICLGYGFVPAVQLARQAGCEHRYDPQMGGWVLQRDEWLQTSLAGIFTAGDGAGIGGKDTAIWEGQLAALGAARTLGIPATPQRVAQIRRELARQQRFAALLNGLFPFPSQAIDFLDENMIVCRCEGIRVKELRQRIAEGADTPGLLRKLTRAGMGRCQGRMCSHAVAEMLSRQTGRPLDQIGVATTRPPVMPIPLEGLIEDPAPPPEPRKESGSCSPST